MNSESARENREKKEFQNNEDQEDIQPKKATAVSQRTNLNTELRRLNTFYNPTTYNQNKSNDVMLEMAHVVIDVGMYNALVSDPKEPETFQAAWDHQDKGERDNWRESIKKELNSMIDKKVWEVKKKHEIPSDRRLIGSKWVFKRKKNGVYRSRLCALGYSQIPGLDFTDNFAPVINEITFRILIGASLIEGWNAEVIDVETAFLYGELEEEIYMKIPEGLEYIEPINRDDECCVLGKAIYGLVQASRQWWKKFTMILVNDLHFESCVADVCLLKRVSNDGVVYLCIYVDDVLLVGNKNGIVNAKQDIGNKFKIKDVGELNEYVGCMVIKDKQKKCAYLIQPDLIEKLEKAFKNDIAHLRKYKMPAPTGEIITRPETEEELINQEDQKKFRSGVGSLLFLIKYSRPDISNAVRGLSKVMDGASKHQLKLLYRVIKYVVDTKTKALKLAPKQTKNDSWSLQTFCDSDYAGDKDGRKSITGYIIYIQDMPIAWKSKSQKNVTLSSSEAEYVAISELTTEILYVRQILEFMGVLINYPIIVRVDNIGAIYLAQNSVSGIRTKHVDIRVHFVRQYCDPKDGILKILFVRSEDNDADIFTKNLNEVSFIKHSSKLLTTVDKE
jgi:hypothetical protein